MIRRPPRSTLDRSSAASDVYKRQILSARVATKLHLGFINPNKFSFSNVSEDITVSYLLTIPIFLLLGIFCAMFSALGHLAGPGAFYTITIALVAGFIATSMSNVVGYILSLIHI